MGEEAVADAVEEITPDEAKTAIAALPPARQCELTKVVTGLGARVTELESEKEQLWGRLLAIEKQATTHWG